MRTYRYRAYPNAQQRRQLARTFGCARWVYNWGLEERNNAYHGDGTRLNYPALCKRLTHIKQQEETAWLKQVSSVVLQQSLRNLERAFTNFFEKRAGYPSFKRRRNKQSATYANSAFRFDPDLLSLTLAKQRTPLKIRWSRPPEGEVVKVTVTLDPSSRYHVCLHCRCKVEPLVKGMMQNHSLARSIAGACWGEIVRQLAYKSAWYGRTLIKVERFFPSSKRCSACGHIAEKMPLSVRRWECEACGRQHGRDVNAARNILAVGHTVSACGALGKTSVAIALQGSGR